MRQQMSFAQAEYAGKKKVTRRERFLGEMEKVVPWARLIGLIAPHYPNPAEPEPKGGHAVVGMRDENADVGGAALTGH